MIFDLFPKFVTSILLRGFEAKDDFLKRIDEIKNNNPDKAIAFVLLSGGIIEFYIMKLFLHEKYGQQFELKYPTRLSSTLVYSFKEFLNSFSRKQTRMKKCSNALKSKHSILLFFEKKERTRAFETPLSEIELSFIKTHNPNTLIVPVLLIWKRVHRHDLVPPSDINSLFQMIFYPLNLIWKLLLGDSHSPTSLRKFFILARGYGKSSLKLLDPIEINSMDAKSLRRKIIINIKNEKRTVLGPRQTQDSSHAYQIVQTPAFKQFLEKQSIQENKKISQLENQSLKIINEISATTNPYYISVMEALMKWIFKNIYTGIEWQQEDFDKLREAKRKGSVVFAANHASYIDFLVLPYVLYRNEFPTPFVVAGINLNFWPVGKVFRSCGAFFIRRTFKGNKVYREVFMRYISFLLNSRYNIKFFIEGTRSRNGKLAPPKFGVLKMILEGHTKGLTHKDINIVPISISYDKLTEQNAHIRELKGGRKPKETFLNIFKSSKIIFKKYGKVHMRFGEPISLNQYIEDNKLNKINPEPSQKHKKLALQKLGFKISHRINKVRSVGSIDILCALALNFKQDNFAKETITTKAIQIKRFCDENQIILHNDHQKNFSDNLQKSFQYLINEEIFSKTSTGKYFIPKNKSLFAHYYKNNMIHAFTPFAIFATVSTFDTQKILHLRSLLEFEFFFSKKSKFLNKIESSNLGDLKNDFALLLDDYLEIIIWQTKALLHFRKAKITTRDWLNKILKFGEELVDAGEIIHNHAVNTQSIKTFLLMAQHKKWLIPTENNPLKFEVNKIKTLENNIPLLVSYRKY